MSVTPVAEGVGLRLRRARRVEYTLLWSSVIYGIVYCAMLLVSPLDATTRSLVANVGYLPVGLIVVVLTIQLSGASKAHPRQQRAWQLAALAWIVTLGADILWAIDENVRGVDPSDGIANIGYILFYPTMLWAFLLLPQAMRSVRDGLKFGLDAATVVVGGGMLVWHFVIQPTLASGEATSTMARVSTLAFPIGDLLVLLGIATVLLRCPRGPRRLPLILLAASMGASMVADIVWAHLALTGAFEAGNIQDVPYMAQYVLFVAGLVLERRRLREHADDDRDLTSRPISALPYASVVLGYGLLIGVAARGADARLLPLVLGAVCLTILVLARQTVAVRENLRLHRERSLMAGDLRFKSLIQHASDIITIVDPGWIVTFTSPSATSTLGLQASQIVGQSFIELVHPDDATDATTRLREAMNNAEGVMSARWRLRCSDGSFIETENMCRNLMSDENVRGLVLTTRDVSQRCALEAQLTHQAFHDSLTGLANRALFQDRVQHALARRRGDFDTLGVIFIDLDHFKTVNDSLGHALGDALLRSAAQRLLAALREFDTAARLGGDEFAVLVDDSTRHEDVVAVADRIATRFLEPFLLGGREVAATASVGVALASPGQTAEDLLRNADLAMYLAKSRGRGQTAMFEPEMHAALLNRLELQADLRHALERNEFTIAYQPLHSLESQDLVGAEALLRWTHPTRGPVPPSTFIPIAEETGLIVPIGRWVLLRACMDAKHWRTKLGAAMPLRLAINLSGRQIPEAGLFDDVAHALAESGLPPGAVTLELTESVLLQHTDQALALMHQLRALGVRLAIDDFGTGYSSLSYLQKLPLDVLKIDRAFVDRIESDASAAALARAIIRLGETMSLRTVAEGIENAHQAERLRALGCDFGQGFFFGMPMGSAEFLAYADRRRATTAA